MCQELLMHCLKFGKIKNLLHKFDTLEIFSEVIHVYVVYYAF